MSQTQVLVQKCFKTVDMILVTTRLSVQAYAPEAEAVHPKRELKPLITVKYLW